MKVIALFVTLVGLCATLAEETSKLALYVVHPNSKALMLTGLKDPIVKRNLEDYRILKLQKPFSDEKEIICVARQPLLKIVTIEDVSQMTIGGSTGHYILHLPKSQAKEIHAARLNRLASKLVVVYGEDDVLGEVNTTSFTGERCQIPMANIRNEDIEVLNRKLEKFRKTKK